MLYLKVPRSEAESVRRTLLAERILSNGYGILKEGDFVLFPVFGRFGDYDIVERDAEKREMRAKKLRDELSGLLSASELQSLTTSFDIVGDIAIVEIPDNLEGREEEIGKALLKVHK